MELRSHFVSPSRKVDLLALLVFAAVALILRGYLYGIGDQCHYIAMLRLRADLQAYPPNDLMHQLVTFHYSYFWPTIARLHEFVDLEWLFFLLYVFGTWLGLVGMFHLTMTLFDDRGISYLACALLLMPKPAGMWHTVYPIYFKAVIIALPVAFFSLSVWLRGQYLAGIALAGLDIIIHPLSGFPLLLIVTADLVWNVRSEGIFRVAKGAALAALALIVWVAPAFLSATPPQLSGLSEEWLAIIRLRAPYIFPTRWPLREWIRVAPFLVGLPFLVATYSPSPRARSKLMFLMLCCVCMWAVGFVFTDVFPVLAVIQLQFLTSLSLWAVASVPFMAKAGYALLLGRGRDRAYANV